MTESSNPNAPKSPKATVATWETKKDRPSWLCQGLDSRTGMARSSSRIIWRMVDPISIVATSGEPGCMRTTNEVWVVNFCEMGK